MKTETVQLGGHPYHLRRWGDPSLPPLLMLHGFPEYGGAWEDLAPHLAQRFHCVAPDLRGYGQSWAPDDVSAYAVSKMVPDMVELIGTLGGRATVLGHDWGAGLAYGLAMFAPDHVDRLVIANGVHPVPFQRAMAAGGAQSAASQYIEWLRRPGSEEELAADDFRMLLRLFSAHMDLSWLTPEREAAYRREWSRPGRLKTMVHWYRASPLKVARPGQPITDLPEFPRERLMVRCPHLLIWGPEDTALLPEATEGLEAFAPDLTRVEIPGTDHWLCHQKPADIARAITDWA